MSESLAAVSIVGLVLGIAAVTVLGLVAMIRNKTLRLKASRWGVDITVEVGPDQRKQS
jgi:hypothetical protein